MQGTGKKNVKDQDVNGVDDAAMLSKSDIIICCRKFLAGWDEWRICAVFLARRISSEEYFQHMRGKALPTTF